MKKKAILAGMALAVFSLGVMAEERGVISRAETAKSMDKGEVSFKNDVQPIIYDHCLNCHIPGGKGYEKSGLDLSSYEGLMKGTMYGPVVIPGNSEGSTFTNLLTGTNAGLKMPAGLNASGTLDRRYIMILRKWVKQGAKNN